MRQVSKASDTVDLNRTVTAYVHGNESFGWRFTPRYQNPREIPNHLRAFAEAAAHPLAHDSPAISARIEPGQGELAAVVLMPSILPRICLTTNANWYRLDDPGRPLIPSDLAMEQGRRLDMLRRTLHSARDAGCYRPTDIAVMTTRIDEIESRLPMQACSVDLPYQNALGGFELFTPRRDGTPTRTGRVRGGRTPRPLWRRCDPSSGAESRPEHDPGGGRREAGG